MSENLDNVGILVGALFRAQESVRSALSELEEATRPYLERFITELSGESTSPRAGDTNDLLKERGVGNLNREMRLSANEYSLVGYDEETHSLEWSAGEVDEFLIRLPIDYILSSSRWAHAFFSEVDGRRENVPVSYGEFLAALQEDQNG